MILGIDEVGRGCWAGPLVVGAVVLGDVKIPGLTDSKKLTAKKRESLANEIYHQALGVGLGWVQPGELDEIGLSQSLVEATKRAVQEVKTAYHEIIIDGTVNFLKDTNKGEYVTLLKKADLLIPSVSAASIVAKVARDNYMARQEVEYPGYGFADHVGYGTAKHRQALTSLGLTPLHRRSFRPIAELSDLTSESPVNILNATTRQIGDLSESIASSYLKKQGYEVISRNWKTKYCEIDIVAKRDEIYYFVEVKHRKTSRQGDGLDAITPKKLRQMAFAAKLYVEMMKLDQPQMRLLAVSTFGEEPGFEQLVEIS